MFKIIDNFCNNVLLLEKFQLLSKFLSEAETISFEFRLKNHKRLFCHEHLNCDPSYKCFIFPNLKSF